MGIQLAFIDVGAGHLVRLDRIEALSGNEMYPEDPVKITLSSGAVIVADLTRQDLLDRMQEAARKYDGA